MCRAIFFGLLFGLLSCSGSDQPSDKKNVIFISIDDLRPELKVLGYRRIKTPNLDSLASNSIVFKNAFAQEPTCGPSRASILTGLRPDSSKVFDIFTPIRTVRPSVKTLPQFLKENGYVTLSFGKVFHHKDEDDSLGWTYPAWRAKLNNKRGYRDSSNIQNINKYGNSSYYEAIEIADTAYEDGKTATKVMQELTKLKGSDKPFFLAIGLFKPHLPFNVPKRYWDMYDSSDFKLTEAYNHPKDRGSVAYNWGGEISSYNDVNKTSEILKGINITDRNITDTVKKISSKTGEKLIHGYLASATYADYQLGKILKEIKKSRLDENTVIVVWSDHGWLLGELGEWAKHGLFDWQARSLLMFNVPNNNSGGKVLNQIVEMIDIYPTVCDLLGFDPPGHLQGESLRPFFKDNKVKKEERFAFTQYPRDYYDKDGLVGRKYFQGYSVRSNDHRYTEWRLSSNQDSLVSAEFYDYRNNEFERKNLIDKSKYATEIKEHQEILFDHFLKDASNNKYEN